MENTNRKTRQDYIAGSAARQIAAQPQRQPARRPDETNKINKIDQQPNIKSLLSLLKNTNWLPGIKTLLKAKNPILNALSILALKVKKIKSMAIG